MAMKSGAAWKENCSFVVKTSSPLSRTQVQPQLPEPEGLNIQSQSLNPIHQGP